MRGLEMGNALRQVALQVTHHMRGLEKKFFLFARLDDRYPPHAWLRNFVTASKQPHRKLPTTCVA